MAQGDCHSPSTFQHVLTWVFHYCIGPDLHIWFDDIFIGTDTIQEDIECLLWVYKQLKSEKLYISQKKFKPYANMLDILGCKKDSDGIHANSDKLAKIRNWHSP